MTRLPGILAAVLVGVLAAPAAPVPKALKKKGGPDVTGTIWVSDENEAQLGVVEYTFQEDGKISWRRQGGNQVWTTGSWKQDGDKLWWELNQKYVEYNTTFADGRFEGGALNVRSVKWAINLKPKAEEK